jgi:hypothetical protein
MFILFNLVINLFSLLSYLFEYFEGYLPWNHGLEAAASSSATGDEGTSSLPLLISSLPLLTSSAAVSTIDLFKTDARSLCLSVLTHKEKGSKSNE